VADVANVKAQNCGQCTFRIDTPCFGKLNAKFLYYYIAIIVAMIV